VLDVEDAPGYGVDTPTFHALYHHLVREVQQHQLLHTHAQRAQRLCLVARPREPIQEHTSLAVFLHKPLLHDATYYVVGHERPVIHELG
jgi:hypothetical protein